MTDRFEDAVRDAARGLSERTAELPTYHDAWQRGRRRRLVKRSALAVAGALVFVAALGVNLGRLPGSDSTETDDVAVAVPAATPAFEPTEVATTAPVETPTDSVGAAPPTVVIPTAPSVAPSDAASAADATDDDPAAMESPTAAPTVAPTVPAPTVPPAPVPTAVAPPTVEPTPEPTAERVTPEPTADAAATGPVPTTDSADDPEPAATGPGDGTDDLPDGPEIAFTTAGIGGPAAAIVLEPAADGRLACDIDNDGAADASCELLPDYACELESEAEPGYVVLDLDGDGRGDTCSAIEITVCDTSGDGRGDTPCIIEYTDPVAGDPDE